MAWVSLIASVVVALAAVIYTAVTYFILRETANSARATREIIEAAYRPYLGASDMRLETRVMGEVTLVIAVSNAGAVPALNADMRVEISIRDTDKRLAPESTKGATIIPGSRVNIRIPVSVRPGYFIDDRTVIRIWINYQGSSGKMFRYEATFRFDPEGDAFGQTSSFAN